MLHFVGHAYMDTAHYVLSANLAPYVGKGRQQAARIIELSDHWYALTSDAAARAGYVLYRALVTWCIHSYICSRSSSDPVKLHIVGIPANISSLDSFLQYYNNKKGKY